jgi:hypothetical protein
MQGTVTGLTVQSDTWAYISSHELRKDCRDAQVDAAATDAGAWRQRAAPTGEPLALCGVVRRHAQVQTPSGRAGRAASRGRQLIPLGGMPDAVARSRHLPGSGGVAYTLTQYPAEERQPGSWERLCCLSSCFSVLYFYSRAARSAPTRRSDSTGAWRLAERRSPLWPPWL